MLSDLELEAATVAYLKARGWSDEIIAMHKDTKAEVAERLKAAFAAVEKLRE